MIVNVEFFGINPMENVITSLHYKVDKTIFFGYQTMGKEERDCIRRFLTKRCGVETVEFCVVSDTDMENMMEVIAEKVRREQAMGNQVFFDLTGGESLLLVTFGILSRQLQASMHMYRLPEDQLYEYGYEDCPMLSKTAEHRLIRLDLDGFISLYGGRINYRMHKNFKDTWSREDTEDVERMWKLYKSYRNKWLYYSALLRKFAPDESGVVCVEADVLLTELKKNKKLGSVNVFHKFLDECEKAGFLKAVIHQNGIYRFTYKNSSIRNYFWESGSILEMHAFMEESREGVSDDCRVGVHIDWDGVFHSQPGKDVLNEIDILSIRNNQPTFMSCKIGNVDQMALYELETVAKRFGGKYAKKVLLVAKSVSQGHRLRAEEMGIEIRQADLEE